jgi:glucose/arabinose dehydrogenase
MRKIFFLSSIVLASIGFYSYTADNNASSPQADTINAGLSLPSGFSAKVVAEKLGRARHIAVTPQGTMYVRLYNLVNGKGSLYLRDLNGDEIFEDKTAFSDFAGTGVVIKNGYLYSSSNKEIYRYKLNDKYEIINPEQPEMIVKGLKMGNSHHTKSIVLDNDDNIYVNIGAPSNVCQAPGSKMGQPNCPLLDSAGGIWQFKANKLNQTYEHGVRYATGLRNVMGLDWNQQNNALFVMQHGRDRLHDNFPDMFDTKMSAELPSECMYMIKKGDNAGWPYSYYDHLQGKKILAPEYGGDGKKEADPTFIDPVVAFPGHLAPNALLFYIFYTGNQFPEKYKNGAFVAFHGSWNRAPEKQEGFFVAFVPFKDGKPSGKWEIFANGFAGSDNITSTGQAAQRPCGLAQGPDGSLYVSEDKKGTIYKITYQPK